MFFYFHKSSNKIKENREDDDEEEADKGDGGSGDGGSGDGDPSDDPHDDKDESLWEEFETIICSVIFILLFDLVNMFF